MSCFKYLQMLIQERIQVILKMHNLTPSAFADKIGVQRSALSHVLTGRNKPGLDFLEKILVNFPRVNAHWLITGAVSPNDSKTEDVVEDRAQQVQKKPIDKSLNPIRIVMFYADGTFKTYTSSEE